jgi:hypothetical protein
MHPWGETQWRRRSLAPPAGGARFPFRAIFCAWRWAGSVLRALQLESQSELTEQFVRVVVIRLVLGHPHHDCEIRVLRIVCIELDQANPHDAGKTIKPFQAARMGMIIQCMWRSNAMEETESNMGRSRQSRGAETQGVLDLVSSNPAGLTWAGGMGRP